MNVKGKLRALKKFGYDLKKEQQELKKIVKDIQISADKVETRLKSFGQLALDDVDEFEDGQESDGLSFCVDEVEESGL